MTEETKKLVCLSNLLLETQRQVTGPRELLQAAVSPEFAGQLDAVEKGTLSRIAMDLVSARRYLADLRLRVESRLEVSQGIER